MYTVKYLQLLHFNDLPWAAYRCNGQEMYYSHSTSKVVLLHAKRAYKDIRYIAPFTNIRRISGWAVTFLPHLLDPPVKEQLVRSLGGPYWTFLGKRKKLLLFFWIEPQTPQPIVKSIHQFSHPGCHLLLALILKFQYVLKAWLWILFWVNSIHLQWKFT